MEIQGQRGRASKQTTAGQSHDVLKDFHELPRKKNTGLDWLGTYRTHCRTTQPRYLFTTPKDFTSIYMTINGRGNLYCMRRCIQLRQAGQVGHVRLPRLGQVRSGQVRLGHIKQVRLAGTKEQRNQKVESEKQQSKYNGSQTDTSTGNQFAEYLCLRSIFKMGSSENFCLRC